MASPAPIRAPKAAPLQRADWIRAGFARLAQDGIDAVRVEVLARDLHVSKGSFYWHFRDRDELVASMLEQWEEDESAWLAAAVADERSAAARWAELVAHLTDAAHGRLEASLRDWARREERAAERARGIERKRREYIAAVLEDVGFTERAAEAWSEMGLLVCLGWVDRASRDPEFRSAPKRGLGDFLSELVLAASEWSGEGAGRDLSHRGTEARRQGSKEPGTKGAVVPTGDSAGTFSVRAANGPSRSGGISPERCARDDPPHRQKLLFAAT